MPARLPIFLVFPGDWSVQHQQVFQVLEGNLQSAERQPDRIRVGWVLVGVKQLDIRGQQSGAQQFGDRPLRFNTAVDNRNYETQVSLGFRAFQSLSRNNCLPLPPSAGLSGSELIIIARMRRQEECVTERG